MSNKSSTRLAPPVVTILAGATLALSACDNNMRTQNPPPPPQTAAPTDTGTPPPGPTQTETPTENPPAPQQWDDVKSGHPEGATNPPSPILVLAADGSCYKHWQPGMMKFPDDVKTMDVGEKSFSVQFTEGAPAQGTPIICPDGAAAALAKHKEGGEPKK